MCWQWELEFGAEEAHWKPIPLQWIISTTLKGSMPECLILAIDNNMHSFLPYPSPKEPDIPARLLPVFLIETTMCKRVTLPGVSRRGAAFLPAGSPFMGMKCNADSLRQVGTYWNWGSRKKWQEEEGDYLIAIAEKITLDEKSIGMFSFVELLLVNKTGNEVWDWTEH